MPRPLTAAERRFWAAAQRRAARAKPNMQYAILRAFEKLRTDLASPFVARLVADGNIDGTIGRAFSDVAIGEAFSGVNEQVRNIVTTGAKATAMADANLRGYFNLLAPEVVDAIRAIETRALGTLTTDVKETVRAFVENGLRDGVNPREIARNIRGVVGLAPNQLEAVANYERALRGDPLAGNPLSRALRDKRFDASVRKGDLTEAQIQKMVDRYRQRWIAWNAETQARTTTLDALREGQRLTWENAIQRGDVDGGTLWKRWVATLDERTRPEHVEAHGIEVRYDALFPVDGGVMTPGEGVYNCRCVALYFTSNQKD